MFDDGKRCAGCSGWTVVVVVSTLSIITLQAPVSTVKSELATFISSWNNLGSFMRLG